MMSARADQISAGLLLVQHATQIDIAILRVRLADDPEAVRTVEALGKRIDRLAEIIVQCAESDDRLLDACARLEEHLP